MARRVVGEGAKLCEGFLSSLVARKNRGKAKNMPIFHPKQKVKPTERRTENLCKDYRCSFPKTKKKQQSKIRGKRGQKKTRGL